MTTPPDPAQIRRHFNCRACNGPLRPILDLGNHRLNDFPAAGDDLESRREIPLVLMVCVDCSLVQLGHTVPPDWMYRTYWYRSAVNESMVAELRGIVKEAAAQVPLAATDYVLDIGANDGTLLAAYLSLPYHPIRAAVEPARNLHDHLSRYTDILIPEYFPTDQLDRLAGRFKVITAIACCYDLEDPVAFFRQIARLLHPAGIAVVQFQDLLQQIHATAFDNIVHEHLEYYTLGSLLEICLDSGLQADRVQPSAINGGSLRVTLRRVEKGGKGRLMPTVAAQLLAEHEAGLSVEQIGRGDLSAFTFFRTRVSTICAHLQAILAVARSQGQVVDWYGASTKSNCTLQVLGWGPGEIRQAIDRNPEKAGRRTITGIPIVGEKDWMANPAPITLIGIWQFKDFVLKRERAYLKQGGAFVIPLPHVEIIQEAKISHGV